MLGCVLRNGSRRTLSHALLAAGTIVRDGPPEDSKPGKDREECTKGTEITAPEPFPHNSQSKNKDKKDKDEKVHLEYGQRNGRHDDRVARQDCLNLG